MSDIEKNEGVVELHSTFSKDNIDSDQILDHIKSIDGRIVEITGDVDEAMAYALDAEEVELTEKDAKKLLRKIDIFLLPLICLLYALQFMDKVSSSYAAVMGLKTYYDMVGNQYSWVGSSFYLGYLVFEFPISMALQRFPVAKTSSLLIIIWGMILCLHATPSTYAGFITLRTLLGIFESGVTPAMVIITGQWYKADEQFLRTAYWFACNGFGTILGSSIAYGLAIRAHSYSMEAWKVLFIVVGCMTIAVGFMILFHVPDLPVKAWFLNETEKKQVVIRIKTNNQGFGNRHFKMHQLKEALLDINTWLFFFFAIATDIPNGALTNFGAILLKDTFGYSSTDSLLMNMPGGAVELVGCILFAYLQKYFKHKLAISAFTMVVTLVASCMLAFAKQSPNARLAGYYLFYLSPVGMICSLSCFTSNVAGHTKKITVNALYLIGYCVGNLIGPQTFIASQAPEYRGGQISMVVCYAVSIFLNLWLYYNYWAENRRRDRLASEGKIENPNIENIEFADLTDKENTNFRYQL
jgi:ACS family allantoate permease-like MFS transporter